MIHGTPDTEAGRKLPAALLPAAAMLAALSAAPAAADAMRVGDLGPVPSRIACLDTASRVLDAYIAQIGGFAISGDPENPEEWAIYAWELKPGVNDVAIACPALGDEVKAILTVHSSGDESAANADAVAGRIRDLWLQHR